MDAWPLTATPYPASQRGVALYIASMVVVLCALLALWAAKSALLLERTSRNDADYQRAFEAAYAMLTDARADIDLHLQAASHKYTRQSTASFLPTNPTQWSAWLAALPNHNAAHCTHGVCYRSTQADNFWENPQVLSQMLSTGARYGSYSGQTGALFTHPILTTNAPSQGAWYWIEPMPLQPGQIQWAPPASESMLFQITAIAIGLQSSFTSTTARARNAAVLQSMVAVALHPDASHPNGYAPTGPMRTLYWRQMQ